MPFTPNKPIPQRKASARKAWFIRAGAPRFSEGVVHLAVDGAFARRPFVDGICEKGLRVVGKLRADANLRYLYTGSQKPKGRRELYDANCDGASWQVFHWSLKRTVVVALLIKAAPDRAKRPH